VPPPPSRGETDAGVLRLSWGDALGQFEAAGWELVDASLDPEDSQRFKTSVGNGALVNIGADATDLVTRGSFGDAHVHVEFMLPEDSTSGVKLGNLGSLNLFPNAELCGSFMGNGVAVGPTAKAFGEAGAWCPLDIYYRAATEESPGFLDRVELNGVTVIEGLEVPNAGTGRAPIRFVGTKGAVAFRNIQVKPLDRPADAGEWEFLDAGASWDDWELVGDCNFELENEELIGKGALGWLWAPVEDLGDATVRARVKINANGAGALIVRAADGDDGVEGYEVRVNASFPDAAMTGSVRAGETSAEVGSELIAADTWADLEVDVRDGEQGTTVTVYLNGVLVNRMVHADGFEPGGLALRCDHDGTVFKIQNIRVRR